MNAHALGLTRFDARLRHRAHWVKGVLSINVGWTVAESAPHAHAVPAEENVRDVVVVRGISFPVVEIVRLKELIRIQLGRKHEITRVRTNQRPLARQAAEVRVRPAHADSVARTGPVVPIASAREPDSFVVCETVILRVAAATKIVLNANSLLSSQVDHCVITKVGIEPKDCVLMRLGHSEILSTTGTGYIAIDRRTNPVLPTDVSGQDFELDRRFSPESIRDDEVVGYARRIGKHGH